MASAISACLCPGGSCTFSGSLFKDFSKWFNNKPKEGEKELKWKYYYLVVYIVFIAVVSSL